MSRLAKLVAIAAASAVVGLPAPVGATLPPPGEPSTTVAGPAPPSTIPGPITTATTATTATTDSPGTTAPVAERGGVGAVDAAKDEEEAWNVRRIATVVGITVVVLAVAGFVYGRVRSARRPVTSKELVRTVSPDVEEAART